MAHLSYLTSDATHSIWPSFKEYLFKHFEWSDHIVKIVQRTQEDFQLRSIPTSPMGDAYMAIHLRRGELEFNPNCSRSINSSPGDFERHCVAQARIHLGFTTWATLPSLENSTFPPSLQVSNESSIVEHCYPPLSRILSIIDHHARSRPSLRTIHMLHDGAWNHPLVYAQRFQLELSLTSAGRARAQGWPNGPMTRVTHSGMLPIKSGEADWTVAVDIELARRAELFIGNGFSSLSSQIIALRLGADGGNAKDVTLM